MSDPANHIKTLFMHPSTDPMKEARYHLAIVEVEITEVAEWLGFPPEFKVKDAMLDDKKLRIKLQHPSFPIKVEGETTIILPLFNKGASVGRPPHKG